jgi:four helix bundle protein
MDKEELKTRTKVFALNIIKLVSKLPASKEANTISYQLLKSGTSIGANYRSALRGRSHAEFISKIGIVEEEADETVFWLELLIESQISDSEFTKDLLKESVELTAIFTATGRTAKQNR